MKVLNCLLRRSCVKEFVENSEFGTLQFFLAFGKIVYFFLYFIILELTFVFFSDHFAFMLTSFCFLIFLIPFFLLKWLNLSGHLLKKSVAAFAIKTNLSKHLCCCLPIIIKLIIMLNINRYLPKSYTAQLVLTKAVVAFIPKKHAHHAILLLKNIKTKINQMPHLKKINKEE